MSRLVGRVDPARLADGSVSRVELWLDPEPADEADVFAAMVVLSDVDGRFVTVWSPRRREWGPPGGWREDGETVVECAVREVVEETGLALAPDQLRPVGRELFRPGDVVGRWPPGGGAMQLYAARVAGSAPPLVASEPDAVDPRWVWAAEFEELSGRQFWWPLVAAAISGGE
jgi:8-oxo-dGTP pyrophosphatase MutT (NUDIX family)